jgi:hypothetical protein
MARFGRKCLRASTLLAAMALIQGCATEPRFVSGPLPISNGERGQVDGDAVKIVSMDPKSPAELVVGEPMTIEFLYSSKTHKQVYLYALPFKNEVKAPGAVTNPSPPFEIGKGKFRAVVVFDRPATVDEIRLFMIDMDSRETVAVQKVQATAAWKAKP